MSSYYLGDKSIAPTQSLVYVYGKIVKAIDIAIIQPGEIKILNTGIQFIHNNVQHLELILNNTLTGQNLALVETTAVTDLYNPLLKFKIKNNSAGVITINRTDILGEVVLVQNIDNHKLTIAESQSQPTDIELQYLDVAAIGSAESAKAVVLDNSLNISGINNISATLVNSVKIGINESTPTAQIEMKQAADGPSSGLRLVESGDVNYWGMYVAATGANLQMHNNGTDLGFVSTSGTNILMNFTGQHRSSTENTLINTTPSDYIGLIVSSSGTYKNLNNEAININDALPVIDLSNIDNDKKVFGVISGREDNDSQRTFNVGAFGTYVNKDNGDERLFINGVGEGMVWVCEKGGSLLNGDFITTSTFTGYGQLQSDDLMHNYTLGKITQDCDFSNPERYVDLSGNEVTQTVYDADTINHSKCNFVGCVYYCG